MLSSMVRLSSCIFSNLQEVAPMNQPEEIIVRTADASETKSPSDDHVVKNNAPVISILIPIYNTERYLEQALDSLRAQTFTDFEAICINDGSMDGSRDIIQKYLDKDSRFRVIDKSNSGYGASMNQGIANACGEYIGILEPDDFFEPNALDLLITNAQQSNADVVKANYWFYWSEPEERNQPISVIKPEMANRTLDPQQDPDIYLALPSIWSAIYRREYLINNNIKFLETPGASFQDLGFTFKIWAYTHNVYLLENPILHYRQDNEASSVNNPDKAFCVCTELEEIEHVLQTLPNKDQLKPYVYRMKYDNYMWNYQRLSAELRKQFLKRMVADLKAGKENGEYNPSIFGSWQGKNLEYLLKKPEEFQKKFPINPSKAQKAWYYFKLGGPKLLIDALNR